MYFQPVELSHVSQSHHMLRDTAGNIRYMGQVLNRSSRASTACKSGPCHCRSNIIYFSMCYFEHEVIGLLIIGHHIISSSRIFITNIKLNTIKEKKPLWCYIFLIKKCYHSLSNTRISIFGRIVENINSSHNIFSVYFI